MNNKDENESFSSLYNMYVHDLLSYGISLGFDEETCRDVVHDVFYKILKERNKFIGVKNITSYLFVTYRNHLRNIYKNDARISQCAFEDIPFSTEVTVLDSLIDEEDTEKLKNTVDRLLNSLTPRQREAIYLRYMQEMEYEEIALLLEMNVNSVRRLVFRGISHLRCIFRSP